MYVSFTYKKTSQKYIEIERNFQIERYTKGDTYRKII